MIFISRDKDLDMRPACGYSSCRMTPSTSACLQAVSAQMLRPQPCISVTPLHHVKESLKLVHLQIKNQTRIGFLEWDRENATNLVKCSGFAVLQKPKEGSDCS